MNPKPDISIALITYRHVKFVSRTLEGVAMQQFSGTVEIVIGDDLSPDGTRAILEEFAAGRTNVKLLFHKKNLGMVGNWLSVLNACSGRYVAVCEGDDYWTDSLKLQRQFNFMEANPSFSMCWHPVEVLSEGVERPYPYAESKEVADVHDLILSHFIPTCSLMYRNGIIREWPQWIYKAMSFDIAMEMVLATFGKAKRLQESMAIYRQHSGGISKSPAHERNGALRQLFILREFDQFTGGRYSTTVKTKMREITAYQLKLKPIKHWKSWPQRIQLFRHRLFASEVKTFRDFRHEVYNQLFPQSYQKWKGN